MGGVVARVHYYQDGEIRFLKGILLEENQDFIKVEMQNYIVTIAKKEIAKLEIKKPTGREGYSY